MAKIVSKIFCYRVTSHEFPNLNNATFKPIVIPARTLRHDCAMVPGDTADACVETEGSQTFLQAMSIYPLVQMPGHGLEFGPILVRLVGNIHRLRHGTPGRPQQQQTNGPEPQFH